MTYTDLMDIIQQRDMTIKAFCDRTGITQQILTNAKRRGGHFSATTMEKMNDFLNENKILEITLSFEESELLKLFRNAEDSYKEDVIDLLKKHQKKEDYSESLKEA